MRLLCTLLFLSFSSLTTAQWPRLPGPPGGGPLCCAEVAGTPQVFAGTVDGVWLSTDKMRTWTSAGLEGREVTKLSAFLRHNKLAVFAVTDSTIYRSADSGKTWTGILTSPYDDASKLFSTIFQSGDSLLVWKRDSILISTDMGLEWSPPKRTFAAIGLVDTLGGQIFGLGDGICG